MNDFEHETLKSFISMFNSYEEFYDRYINHYKICNKTVQSDTLEAIKNG